LIPAVQGKAAAAAAEGLLGFLTANSSRNRSSNKRPAVAGRRQQTAAAVKKAAEEEIGKNCSTSPCPVSSLTPALMNSVLCNCSMLWLLQSLGEGIAEGARVLIERGLI
jgi:hypothetical protein